MGRRYFQTQYTEGLRYAILEGKSKELLIERLLNNTQKDQSKSKLRHQCRSIMSRKKISFNVKNKKYYITVYWALDKNFQFIGTKQYTKDST